MFVSASLSLLLVVATTQEPPRKLYGKTQAQAVAMGVKKWMDFVATQEDGSSTSGMTFAMGFYEEGLQKKTDVKMAKWPAARREAMRSLRERLKNYSANLRNQDAVLSGGGTMHRLFLASSQLDAEELIEMLVDGKFKKAPARVVSDVVKELDKRRPLITKHQEVSERPEEFTRLRKAQESLYAIAQILRTRPRGESDLVLEWCLKEAQPFEGIEPKAVLFETWSPSPLP